jgi:hypothetical protein
MVKDFKKIVFFANTVSVRNQNLHFITKYGLLTVKKNFAIIFRNAHLNYRISEFIRLRKPNITQLYYVRFKQNYKILVTK